MGAGNPLVCSYDDDRISINTFFLEGNLQDVDDYIAEYAANNDGETISTDTAYQDMADQDYDSFLQMFYTADLAIDGWKGERVNELSSAFRGDGIIIARGNDICVVVPSGCDPYHIGFAFIPSRSWNSFWEEMHDEHAHKRQWYDRRNLNFDNRMYLLADRAYSSYIRKCNTEIKKVAASIAKQFRNKYFEENFTVRSGAWTSSSINKSKFKSLATIN